MKYRSIFTVHTHTGRTGRDGRDGTGRDGTGRQFNLLILVRLHEVLQLHEVVHSMTLCIDSCEERYYKYWGTTPV